MSKLNGGIIGPDNVPTGAFGSASGVWSLSDVTNYKKQGTWPIALTGYQVDNSVRLDTDTTFTRTLGASPTNAKKGTISLWFKKVSTPNSSNYGRFVHIGSTSNDLSLYTISDTIAWYVDAGTNGSGLTTGRIYRDESAWYHLIFSLDSTLGTAADRIKLYVNGELQDSSSFPQNTNITLNTDIFDASHLFCIGATNSTSLTQNLDGYISEFVYVDGTALDATSFGETDSVTNNWVPKDVSGLTFGTNGFYLDFKDSSALGNDVSGNNNDLTANNLTSIDQSVDTGTNNFATLNALTKNTSRGTLSNGNLTYVATDTNWSAIPSTLGVSSGKWYAEFKFSSSTGGDLNVGVVDEASLYNVISSGTGASDFYMGKTTGSYGYFNNNGNKVNNASSVSYGDTWTNDDVISVALNMDDGEITFYKNGVSQGVAYTGLSGTYFIGLSTYRTGNANFGNPSFSISSGNTDSSGMGNFEYAVPSGYYSLCTRNLNLIG